MTLFRTKKSFGPRISLTEKQQEKLIARCNAAGLTCDVENCHTGSVYVSIGKPEWEQNINGEWYNTLDCGCGSDVAKIRLSGHDEGRMNDSTHNFVGGKPECVKALSGWVSELIAKHSEECLAILADKPAGVHFMSEE